jgi:hypothetical protein
MTPYEALAILARHVQELRKRNEQLCVAGERLLEWHRSSGARRELFTRVEAIELRIAPKSVGRPATWKGPIGEETVASVEAMRLRGLSTIEALRVLRKKQPWTDWWAGHSEKGLRTRYREALKYWQPIFEELEAAKAAMDEICRSFEDLQGTKTIPQFS